MTSKAMCQVDACTCLFDDPPVAISGILQLVPLPCPESTEDIPCPPCLTVALNANEQLYYLNVWNDNLNALLDTLVYPVNATVTGHVYTAVEEGLAIRVQDISLHASLPSLCDEWNVLYEPFSWPGGYNTFKYYLSTDTIINGKQYVKLASDKDYPYCGAFREDNNANIYYIPSGSTHEYLIYAFNAQVGDTLVNLWVGGFGEDYQGVVQAISNGSPRIFIIGVKFYENSEYYSPIRWIEGVGSPETPMGLAVVPTVPADIGVFNLLCAYKNGQQVYATQLSEQFGCFYEGHNPPPTTDTIPLYAQDDPGSSTVDPVDPNQVVATLKGDELTIREKSGVDVTYSLQHNAPAKMPSQNKAPQSNSFRDEITVQITETGEYLLQLTNPSWGYTIFGRFYYSPQGVENVHSTSVPQKVLQNGQLYILRGEKVYTLTGQKVR